MTWNFVSGTPAQQLGTYSLAQRPWFRLFASRLDCETANSGQGFFMSQGLLRQGPAVGCLASHPLPLRAAVFLASPHPRAARFPDCARQDSSQTRRAPVCSASRRAGTCSAAAGEVHTDAPLRAGRMVQQRQGAPIPAGPTDSPPDYTEIDSKPYNRLFMHLFRQAVVKAMGEDAPEPGFDGIITLTRRLSRKFDDPRQSRELVRGILASLFPPGLLPAFRVMFARPIPEFSHWLNALVTAQTCQWLMGPSVVSDVELDDGTVIEGHGVRVERCRVLEQSGCASVCVNCCKLPTQEFFTRDMGLDLRMTPNYEDFSCQFNFGQKPLPPEQDPALASPCFLQCPSKMVHSSRPLCSGLDSGSDD